MPATISKGKSAATEIQSHPAFTVCNSSALHHVFLDSGKHHELDVVVSVFLLYIRETGTQPRLLGLRLRLDGF